MLPEPDAAKAEAYFERALAVARQQEAKSWELRAAMSMARAWRDQGKREEARELLAPVYGWFTEGFDTRDLKEAKVLLETAALDHAVRLIHQVCCFAGSFDLLDEFRDRDLCGAIERHDSAALFDRLMHDFSFQLNRHWPVRLSRMHDEQHAPPVEP
jgi:hypothetical protein